MLAAPRPLAAPWHAPTGPARPRAASATPTTTPVVFRFDHRDWYAAAVFLAGAAAITSGLLAMVTGATPGTALFQSLVTVLSSLVFLLPLAKFVGKRSGASTTPHP
jgi:hypothetical protein